MNKKLLNEREKLLMISIGQMSVGENRHGEESLKTEVNDLDIPSTTSDLTNDSGFLTAHQDISGKENTANKTTSISANPNDTKYPTEKAVADYVANNSSSIETDTTLSSSSTDAKVPTSKAVVDYVDDTLASVAGLSNSPTTTTIDENSTDNNVPTTKAVADYVVEKTQNDDFGQNSQITEIQTQIQNLGGTILLTKPEVTEGSKITSITQLSALNNQFDKTNFNTSAHEKLTFRAKGSNGPTATIFFRQAPFISLTPKIVLLFFLQDIPSGSSSLNCNITLNDTIISSSALTVVSNQSYQAKITLSNVATANFNKLEITFNDNTLEDMQLNYLDITITNTQNCIILNRDNGFGLNQMLSSDKTTTYSLSTKVDNGIMKYCNGTNLSMTNLLNPTTIFSNGIDTDGNDACFFYGCMAYLTSTYSNSDFTTLTVNTNYNFLYTISNTTQKLWHKYPDTILLGENVMDISFSLQNGDANTYASAIGHYSIPSTCMRFLVVKKDYSITLFHATSTSYQTPFYLQFQYLPKEFVGVCGIQDLFCRGRTSAVNNVGYLFIHKTGTILFFPQYRSSYCIKIGKGRQINAYLSEDGLSINIYFNNSNNVYKKTLSRTSLQTDTWTLSNTTKIFYNTKEIKEIYSNYIYQDLELTWHEHT